MIRFTIFVDGSNLSGSLNHLGLKVDDYEKFYDYIFRKAFDLWKNSVIGAPAQVRLNRILWYTIGTIDEWDLDDDKVKSQLSNWFNKNTLLKRNFSSRATNNSTHYIDPFSSFLDERKKWYESKKKYVNGLHDFHFAVSSESDFINIIPCGRLKVDIMNASISEKGLDTSLAVDMVALADTYDVALIISGDADSIPSIEYVKRQGKHVVVAEFIKGYPPEEKGRQFSSKLKAVADLIVPIYEIDLKKEKVVNEPLKFS